MIGFYLFAFDIKTNIPYILFNHFSFYSFLSSQQNKPFRMFLLSSAFLPPSQLLLLKWFAPHDIADNLVGRKWQFLNAYVFEFWSCIKYAIVSFLFIFPHVELFILYTHAHTHTHTHTNLFYSSILLQGLCGHVLNSYTCSIIFFYADKWMMHLVYDNIHEHQCILLRFFSKRF
jgi:hypothetical protein